MLNTLSGTKLDDYKFSFDVAFAFRRIRMARTKSIKFPHLLFSSIREIFSLSLVYGMLFGNTGKGV